MGPHAVLALASLAATAGAASDPEDIVDPLMGTRSRIDFSTGNIQPFTGRPWGMNQWSPQTNNYQPSANSGQKSWWFHPDDKEMYGIRCTHQPSPWIKDYGQFLVLLEMGSMAMKYPDKVNTFKDVRYSPYQFDAAFDNHCDGAGRCMTLNLTGTERGAIMKLTFPPYDEQMQTSGWDQTRRIRIALGSNATDSIDGDAATGRMWGWSQANQGGVPKGTKQEGKKLGLSLGETCEGGMTVVEGTGYSGNDVYHFQVNDTDVEAAGKVCLEQCCADDRCKAWTIDFAKTAHGVADRFNCSDAFPCCWIKNLAEDNGARGPHIAGYKKGCGPETVEVKFHHYFVMETEPAGAVKFGLNQNLNDNMWFAGVEGFLEFEPNVTEITIRIATSFISFEQAKLNLDRELPADKSFEDIAAESKKIWRDTLSVADVETATGTNGVPLSPKDEERLRVFYSSIYRASIFPRSLAEVAENGSLIHYSPYDSEGRVFPGEISTDSGFWDAYRTVYQYGALLHPKRYVKIIQGWMNAYTEQGGWLPSWPSPGERGAMAATMQDAVLADAIMRDLDELNNDDMYEAIAKDAFTVTSPGTKRGRSGLDEYIKYGYLAEDGNAGSQVATTLNFNLADYSMYLAATKLGKDDDAKKLLARSQSWKKLFDPEAKGGSPGIPGFFRPKYSNGSFMEELDVYAWGGPNNEYTEASPYQYRFYVPHDPQGLAEMYGGGDTMCKALEEMMVAPTTFHKGSWGIHHEQIEMKENCFGLYEHNNQPVHHVLYMFKGAGCPAKGQYWLRYTMDKVYGDKPGFSGDEDNGEMAAWFVLSALGLYQLVPGSEYYEIGSPLFTKAKLNVGDATVEIEAPNNTASTPYVKSVTFNGNPLTDLRVKYADLQKGGKLVFEMSSNSEDAERFFWGEQVH